MLLKLGSKGEQVKILQEFLGLNADGNFGPKTEKAVKDWQKKNKLVDDGIVGSATWNAMGIASTDISESKQNPSNFEIKEYLLPPKEYLKGPTKKEYLFLHHTAGWHNPYNTIDQWAKDTRGQIATEFVMGGPSVKGDDFKFDGEIVKCIPDGGYGWHLGANGSQTMHKNSVGIEVCNFGQLTKGGYTKSGKFITKDPKKFYTYSGAEVHESQIVTLKEKFRGYDTWHRYSDEQIESLRDLILFIANRDSIDIRKGLIEEIKKSGVKGFDFNPNAFNGKVKGMWTHTNTRKDKFDMFPQQELIDMLLSL